MEKEFIPYEQALELKELGFDEPCFAIWSGFDEINFSVTDKTRLYSSEFRINDTQSAVFYINDFKSRSRRVAAPIFSQVFSWFREKYELLNHLTTHLNPYREDDALEESYGYRIMFNKDGWKCDVWEEVAFFDTYEEAELECLRKLIEIVKD